MTKRSEAGRALPSSAQINPKLFRSPYMADSAVLESSAMAQGYQIVFGYTVGDADPTNSIQDIEERIEKFLASQAADGPPSVLIFHDTIPMTYENVGNIVRDIQARGYRLGGLQSCQVEELYPRRQHACRKHRAFRASADTATIVGTRHKDSRRPQLSTAQNRTRGIANTTLRGASACRSSGLTLINLASVSRRSFRVMAKMWALSGNANVKYAADLSLVLDGDACQLQR